MVAPDLVARMEQKQRFLDMKATFTALTSDKDRINYIAKFLGLLE
jgi:hypothetical protein